MTFNSNKKRDYVDIVYNQKDRPFTNYPSELIKHLISKFSIRPNSSVLELGCGRGEFLNEFLNNQMQVCGVDLSNSVTKYFPKIDTKVVDLTKDILPFNDNSFDVVYSKSFVEHFYFPEKIFEEAYRVLKKGGVIITLTPEWEYIYKIFYEDYTHRTPFTKTSIKDIHLITGFHNVQVESFKQLPILWKRNFFVFFFKFFSFLTRVFIPDYFRISTKWIRFSKELMILSKAEK
jgi:SAM-dependent methyltransferase